MRPLFLVVRLLKILSWLGALAFLLYSYYYLPDQIAIHYNHEGVPDNFLSRESFFYIAAGFIILVNVILSLIGRLVLGLPNQAILVPNANHWLANKTSREQLMYILRNWINALALILNVYTMAMLFITLRLHTNQRVFLSDFTWILFAGVALIVVWIIYLPIRLRFKQTVEI
ncbi:DUF1648 domain-containing protein [Cytophagaceae bacterium YF14B1]|uniref:DUF1648 domain-containing protein n=1 Tax=Xanthocytophaga flava TaxID=3048013 RepID=A0AAE3QLB1_9BACT|nr:DUF1648 domain-containing protein [Xanthocytophaga flavus]MDJ1481020.1 DUF1648 domain-containing protein [Xanthocytophaga flavus]